MLSLCDSDGVLAFRLASMFYESFRLVFSGLGWRALVGLANIFGEISLYRASQSLPDFS
jgi:hypothetical protein